MPSILQLDPTRVGPRDAFTLTLTDNSLDFTVVGSSIQWFLLTPGGSGGAIYHRVPSATVIDATTMSLVIDSVGPNLATQVPVGTYLVVGRISFWEGNSHQHLQVVIQSQTQPPPSPPTITSIIPRTSSLLQMFFGTMRWRLAALRSRLTLAINILGQRMGLFGPIFQVLQQPPPVVPVPSPFLPESRILPLVDGDNVFPEVANLIQESEHFCYIGIWGFDEDVRFNDSGQSNAPDAATLLRAQSVALARLAESRVTGRAIAHAHGDVRVLVWDATLDDDFSGNGNNIGSLGTVMVPWRNVRGMLGVGLPPICVSRVCLGRRETCSLPSIICFDTCTIHRRTSPTRVAC